MGFGLLYLVIVKKFELLFLLFIGFGVLFINIFIVGFLEVGGLLYYIYKIGIDIGVFFLFIFMGVGVMIDFSVFIVNFKMLLFGVVV